jgi:hypothetical protein
MVVKRCKPPKDHILKKHAYVQFQIEEIRPFADFGRTWRKSIGAE